MHNTLMSIDFDLPCLGSGYHAAVRCSRTFPWEIRTVCRVETSIGLVMPHDMKCVNDEELVQKARKREERSSKELANRVSCLCIF